MEIKVHDISIIRLTGLPSVKLKKVEHSTSPFLDQIGHFTHILHQLPFIIIIIILLDICDALFLEADKFTTFCMHSKPLMFPYEKANPSMKNNIRPIPKDHVRLRQHQNI